MMALALYASLLGGWMVLALTALLVTGGALALRGLLAVLLLVLCGVGCGHGSDMARIMTGCAPALALCVWVFGPSRAQGNTPRGADVLPFFLSGIAALALAFGRCDLLVALLGCGLVARLGLAIGPRGLDRDGWQALRMGLGGLLVAQGGLFVLQAGWGHMQDQAGAVLLVGGLLLACGVPGRPGPVMPGWNMETLAVLPVVARAADVWPVLLPVLTFMGCVCLSWAVLSRRGQSFPDGYWAGWAVLAAGLPGGGMGGLPLAACLLVVACVTPSGGGLSGYMLWPPSLPGMAVVLVLVGEMGDIPPVALLAGVSLWPVMAARIGVVGYDRSSCAQASLLLAIGCVVLACVAWYQMGSGW